MFMNKQSLRLFTGFVNLKVKLQNHLNASTTNHYGSGNTQPKETNEFSIETPLYCTQQKLNLQFQQYQKASKTNFTSINRQTTQYQFKKCVLSCHPELHRQPFIAIQLLNDTQISVHARKCGFVVKKWNYPNGQIFFRAGKWPTLLVLWARFIFSSSWIQCRAKNVTEIWIQIYNGPIPIPPHTRPD